MIFGVKFKGTKMREKMNICKAGSQAKDELWDGRSNDGK